MEAQAQNADAEVDGVAGQLALGPAPVAVLDDETWFANLENENTRRAYRNDVGDFIRFAAIERPEDSR